jgi:arylformamidase
MRLIDISVAVHPGMPVWEGDPPPLIERAISIEGGAEYNLSRLAFSAHTGTHVDAPLHFIDGAGSVDGLALGSMIGKVQVIDARSVEQEIDAEIVERNLPSGCERVLFATRNSELWERSEFSSDFVSISPRAASVLVGRGLRLVGIDYLSVGGPEAHRTLLSAGVVLLEGLDLRSIEAGEYELACLPLRVAGADGAPARAILIER